MNKVYLLLRNNKQSGPHSLDELLQLQLKPFDLIWVEGRSAGWSYPSEIETLKPYIVNVPQPALQKKTEAVSVEQKNSHTSFSKPAETNNSLPKKPKAGSVFVSLPNNTLYTSHSIKEESPTEKLEKKAEELFKRAQAFAAENKQPSDSENIIEEHKEVNTKYSRSLDDIEKEYTDWVYKKKTKKKNISGKKAITVTLFILSFLIVGYFLATKLLNGKMTIKEPVSQQAETQATPLPANDTHTAADTSNNYPSAEVPLNDKNNKTIVRGGTKKISLPMPVAHQPKSYQPAKTIPAETIAGNNNPSTTGQKLPAFNASKEAKEKTAVAEVPKQKNKGLKEIINTIFSKQKPNEAAQPAAENDSKQSTNTGTTERQATHREENPSSETTAPSILPEQLELTATEKTDNWMIGVYGLKLTVHNHSNEFIKTAGVDVFYYDEYNRLLEKRLLYFNNIPPKGSLTLPAPDQRWADHINQRLVMVKGN